MPFWAIRLDAELEAQTFNYFRVVSASKPNQNQIVGKLSNQLTNASPVERA